MWRIRWSPAATLTVDAVMAVPPAAVWEALTDTAHWHRWGPTVTGADLDPPADDGVLRAGSTGRVRVPGGLALPFRVTEFTPGRSWAWRVAGVPATAHSVVAHPDGARTTFSVPALAAPYLAVCALALPRVEAVARERM